MKLPKKTREQFRIELRKKVWHDVYLVIMKRVSGRAQTLTIDKISEEVMNEIWDRIVVIPPINQAIDQARSSDYFF